MHIHEYQAKGLLSRAGIAVHDFRIVEKVEDAPALLEDLGITEAVVKVQIHAGGRGKAGGVKIGTSRESVLQLVREMMGMKIVTKQTGSEGVIVHRVMISELADIRREYYVSMVVDRREGKPMFMISPEGGVEIEEVAALHPEKIFKVHTSIRGTVKEGDLERLAEFMGWIDEVQKEEGKELFRNLACAFVQNECTLLEINPLIEDGEGHLWALDAKMTIDDNALFRHPNLKEMYDPTQETEQEAIAHELDIAYIGLDGNIGCMVNGAGLAMATMDLIKYHGGAPANFLDVGGSASKDKVKASFALILSDPKVKAILVNIFGGIMKCDIIAEGIILAAREMEIRVPVVVRLEGTNVEEGKGLLRASGLAIIAADDLTEAAEKVVRAVV
ncbi:MAG: succinate--CoA ligase subunit beta [Chlamydiae bacterium RIFCSPHIGHO2_12_FULL_49_11]|nr:MAG: succinate--CoA ligase subunit beta [Chlamydiae bacterium RIFCSPHIGHO2_12_FULL_49_11]